MNTLKINNMTEYIHYPLPGEKYQHYKGGKYEVICLANHTDNNEPLVIYKSLSFGSIYARPLKEWFDIVNTKYFGGREIQISRFEKI
jgi:hypothetical protein